MVSPARILCQIIRSGATRRRGRRLTKNAPLKEEECVRITDVELALENIEGDRGRLWRPAMYKDEERSFTAQVR